MTDPHHPHRRGFLASLRASFLTGLVVVLPIGLTIYFVWAFVGWLDGWILPLIPASYQPDALIGRWFGPEYEFPVRGVGVLVFLFFTIIIGWMAKGIIGRSVIRQGENLVDRMPVIRSRPKGELADRLAALGPDMSAVFVGLTPFTSGMLLFVPTKDLILMDMGVDDAAKLIVSGGLVYPLPKEVD